MGRPTIMGTRSCRYFVITAEEEEFGPYWTSIPIGFFIRASHSKKSQLGFESPTQA
jgi:hypothetical protein